MGDGGGGGLGGAGWYAGRLARVCEDRSGHGIGDAAFALGEEGHVCFVNVRVGGRDDALATQDLVRTWCVWGAAHAHTYLGSTLHARFEIRGSGLHRPHAAAEWIDTHDARWAAGEGLVARDVGAWRRGGAVKSVDGVEDGEVPVAGGRAAGDEGGSGGFHDRADGTLGDAIKLVDIWRGGGLVDAVGGDEVSELSREELTSVIRVKSAYDVDGGDTVLVWLSVANRDFFCNF